MKDFILGVLFTLALVCLLSWASTTRASSSNEELKCGNLVDIHRDLYKEFDEVPKNVVT